MTSAPFHFALRGAKIELEEGRDFAPKFDADGLIVCIAQHAETLEVLMVAHMNVEALSLTLQTGIAHYWSRSRRQLWRKGDTSGQVQQIVEAATDCDQDSILLKIIPGGDGGACHTGRKSCFYRRIDRNDPAWPLVMKDEA